MNTVVDLKPNNLQVKDIKPNNQAFGGRNYTYTETRTVQAGQSMGLLLALTYPIAGTFSNTLRL